MKSSIPKISASSIRRALATVGGLLALAGGRLEAQGAVLVTGHVRVGTSGAAPGIPGAMVILHRIGQDSQGPIDSTITSAGGGFRFRFRSDTSALFILTTSYRGIQYFSSPLGTDLATPDTGVVLQVFDTSSTAPVHTEARHIVIARPADDGTRTVVELLVLDNPGERTRVTRDTSGYTWMERIPPEAFGFSAEDRDLSAGAVDRNVDTAFVLAPLAPGEREITMQYLMPPAAGRLRFPFDERVTGVNVLVEEPDATVSGGGLAPTDSVTTIQGRPFRRFTGIVDSGQVVTVTVKVPARLSRRWLAVLVGVLGLLFVAALVRALRRPAVTSAAPEASVDALLARVATIDDQIERLPAGAEARAALLAQRDAAKAALADALAQRRRQPLD